MVWLKNLIQIYIGYLPILLTGILSLQACNPDPEEPLIPDLDGGPQLNSVHQYFIDVAFGNEFGGGYSSIRKWSSNIKLFVPETKYDYLNEELDAIIDELNSLLGEIQIERVTDVNEANYIVYFGNQNTYVNTYEPNAAGLVESNWGVFYIYWDSNWSINRGSMYVDIIRTLDLDCQKHLLREELTQSLGLMNDTFDYPGSIFYQNWTCGTNYAEIDRRLIEILYDPEILPGMLKQEVINYLIGLQTT